MATLNRAQKIGAQAITGAFRTVAVAIAEVEAYIRPIQQRQFERAVKLWIGIQTFPDTRMASAYAQLLQLRTNRPTVGSSPVH
jgi:hypothetical protein